MSESVLQRILERVDGQMTHRLGIVIVEASPETVVATMPVDGNRQHVGSMHGGAYCALGETLASLASILHAGDGFTAYGIELSASHHRRVTSGSVTAIARALSLGRTLCTHEVVITDSEDQRVSTVRVTNIIRRLDH